MRNIYIELIPLRRKGRREMKGEELNLSNKAKTCGGEGRCVLKHHIHIII